MSISMHMGLCRFCCNIDAFLAWQGLTVLKICNANFVNEMEIFFYIRCIGSDLTASPVSSYLKRFSQTTWKWIKENCYMGGLAEVNLQVSIKYLK